MREYNLPPSSFHPTFVSGGLMLIHTNWLHYSRFIHLHCFFSLFRDHSSLPSLLPRLSWITLNILDRYKILLFFFLSSFPIFHSHEIPVEETCCLAIFIFKKVFYCEIPNRDLIIQLCVHRDSSDYSLFHFFSSSCPLFFIFIFLGHIFGKQPINHRMPLYDSLDDDSIT